MRARVRPARLVIIGHPIAHSLSPVFQNAALQALQLPLRYEALDVAPSALRDTMMRLALEQAGGNVTIPHKEAVAAMARCSPLAERVGAVNTFWHHDGELVGHNTDVAGASATIAALQPDGVHNIRCALLGAGGSAAAVLMALHEAGCAEISVAARTPARAHQLAERIGVRIDVVSDADAAVRGAALVINATPIGLRDDAMPIAPEQLASNASVFDLVYRRGGTPWVRACRAAGHRAEDGQRMLLEQGAAAFTCWTGMTAPRDVMQRALDDGVESSA